MGRQSLSIIVPVYNAEIHLNECIDSTLAQTHQNYELILVDDGSTDKSHKICDDYAIEDERVRVIHKTNGGPQSAVISGLKISQGQFIGFVDSDDWIDKQVFSELIKTMLENDTDIIQC